MIADGLKAHPPKTTSGRRFCLLPLNATACLSGRTAPGRNTKLQNTEKRLLGNRRVNVVSLVLHKKF